MNFIAIHGRLVRDPEMRRTQSGVAVTTITVAVDRAYSGDGEKQADFFDCVFWRQGAEFVSKYFTKGKEIIVTGEMQSRKWTDKDGNNRISLEIQNAHAEFCGSAKSSDTAQNTTVQPATSFVPIQEPDAQLPF
jgi:single-strand DNA-binding protein